MLLEIEHRLRFRYDDYIHESHVELRMQPRSKRNQALLEWNLEVGPRTRPARWAEDWLGNIYHWFAIADWHDRIEVLCRSVVETSVPDQAASTCTDSLPVSGHGIREFEFLEFGGPILHTDALERVHREAGLADAGTIGEWVQRLSGHLKETFTYMPEVTRYDSTTEEVLTKRAGVCQDFAHLSIGLARLSGIPARYVNGYLHQSGRDEPAESHAWFELWSPSSGWLPYDATHHVDPGVHHVVVAYGRSYDDVPPNRGIYAGNASETLETEVYIRSLEARAHRAPLMRTDSMDLPLYPVIPTEVDRDHQHPRHGGAEDQQQQQQQ
ncbi:MAG: transglutaminase family protein [Phycisphaerales bacterium]|nr:transglutaminase family protein [Phycisphaerales bacterium]